MAAAWPSFAVVHDKLSMSIRRKRRWFLGHHKQDPKGTNQHDSNQKQAKALNANGRARTAFYRKVLQVQEFVFG